ncbi:MAG: hypothetical protein IKY21_03520 [Clostridia bacterium]|nr:hypothetical protein [Clostridia bacterium]
MKSRFTRYFGANVARKIYIACIALIAIGFVIGYMYWWYYASPFVVIGTAGFLICYGIQVSDKDVDEHIQKTVEDFKNSIDGREIGKTVTDARNFSVFQSFLREDGETRFKAGSDGKLRTSKYFITAVSAEGKDLTVFTAKYDLFSEETPKDSFITTKGADSVEMSREIIEFPGHNRKCTLKVTRENVVEELTFFLPDDSFADKMTARFLK